MLGARRFVGSHDVILITLDTLRFDVAERALARGMTPNLARVLPRSTWERRHSPATFTYAAHHAFFAGFLPTPASPGPHPRLFAAQFAGSETTTDDTIVFDTANIVSGFRSRGYHTICIGGVGFFNNQTALGRVLPDLFDESHWSEELGVTSPSSTERQVELALRRLAEIGSRRVFMFINISALHQPNCIFAPGTSEDSPDTQAAALAYVDANLPPLLQAFQARGSSLWIVCSDHGTAYGEDGFVGHRLSHPVILDVPYAEFVLEDTGGGH